MESARDRLCIDDAGRFQGWDQRQPAGKQGPQHSTENGDLILLPDSTQYRHSHPRTIEKAGPAIGVFPAPETSDSKHYDDCNERRELL